MTSQVFCSPDRDDEKICTCCFSHIERRTDAAFRRHHGARAGGVPAFSPLLDLSKRTVAPIVGSLPRYRCNDCTEKTAELDLPKRRILGDGLGEVSKRLRSQTAYSPTTDRRSDGIVGYQLSIPSLQSAVAPRCSPHTRRGAANAKTFSHLAVRLNIDAAAVSCDFLSTNLALSYCFNKEI